MFQGLMTMVRQRVTYILANVEVRSEGVPNEFAQREPVQEMVAEHPNPEAAIGQQAQPQQQPQQPVQAPVRTHVDDADRNPNDPRTWGKVQRNAPCPCGSGKKFKHCHGAVAVS